jgi:hypothetical protein
MEGRVIILILLFISMFSIASASSLDVSDWSFRREIVLSGSKALSDYQLKVSLDTKSLVVEGKMRSDCGDVRFTDSDKFSTLSYFLEGGCNTNDTVFWVNVPNIYPEKNFFAYYGQPAAESESSGDGTFVFFDGFEGNSLDRSAWNQPGCVSVYGGYAHMYSQNDPCYLTLVKDLPGVGVIQLKARRGHDETGVGPAFTVSYEDALPAFEMSADAKEKKWMLYSRKPSPTSVYGGALDLNDHVFRIAYDNSGRIYYFYIDSSLVAKNRAFSPGSLGSLNLLAGDSNGPGISDSYYAYFFIRKYADPEPEINISGEEALTPVITLAEPALDSTTTYPTRTVIVTSSSSDSSSTTAVKQVSITTIVSAVPDDIRREKNSSEASSQDNRSILDFFSPFLIAGCAIALISVFAFYRKRKEESSKENKEVLRWISNELLSGENPEVIKKAVSDSGMDPSIVDKAKKTLR